MIEFIVGLIVGVGICVALPQIPEGINETIKSIRKKGEEKRKMEDANPKEDLEKDFLDEFNEEVDKVFTLNGFLI